jgi:hypothetical protein
MADDYMWTFGDMSSDDGGRYAFHTYANWGTYVVTLTTRNKFGCDSMTPMIISVDPAGIESQGSAVQVRLYPNPVANGELNLEIAAQPGGCQVRITDMQGRQCYSANMLIRGDNNRKSINLSGYRSGLYLVTVTTDQGVFYGKVVVE